MKMVAKTLILIQLLLYYQHQAEADLEDNTINFIRDYFKRIEARVVRIFTCSNYDKLRLVKRLQSLSVWLVVGDARGSAFPPYNQYIWEPSPLKADYYKFGLFLDYDCSSNQEIFMQSAANRYVNTNHYWLIWSRENNYSVVEDAHITIDSELTWAQPNEKGLVQLHDLYKINFTWPLSATSIGKWDALNGLTYNVTGFKYTRRQNLQQLHFDTAIAVYHEEIQVDDIHKHLVDHNEANFTTTMTRCSYSMFMILRDKFNLTYTLHLTSTSKLDSSPNGSFDGQIGMMQRHEITFTPSPLLILPSRQNACDFLAVVWKFETAAIFRHPKVTGGHNALLAPFTVAVWMCAMGSWLLAFFTIKMAIWFESKYARTDGSEPLEASWSTSALATVGAVSEQGTELDAKSITWRITLLFILIQVVLLNTYYGGGVVSTLLTEPPKTIRTVKDILNSNLKVGYENVSHNVGFFQRVVDPVVLELYHKKIFPPTQSVPNAYRVDIGVSKIKEENFAFQVEQIQAYPFIEKTFTDAQRCALTEVVIFPLSKNPTFSLMPKRSPYREMFQHGYCMLWERGITNYKWLEWRPRKPQCLGTGDVVSVEIGALGFAFLILVCGSLASIIIFSSEIISFYRGSLKCYKRGKIFQFRHSLCHEQDEKLFYFYRNEYLP